MQECKLLGQVGIPVGLQLGEKLLDMDLCAFEDLPQFFHNLRQILKVAPFVRYHEFPVPLVHICAVIVIKEIVLAHGVHIGIQALPHFHPELLQRHALPLGCGLHYLGINRVLVIIV